MPISQASEPGATSSVAHYVITRTSDGWSIVHDGVNEGSLDTKMAAFDAAVSAAVGSILAGHGVVISVPSDAEQGSGGNLD